MHSLKFSTAITSFFIGIFVWQLTHTVYKTIDKKKVYDVSEKKVYYFQSGLMIDADGAPMAYHKDNSKALDYLANAGKPGNWWALVTDNKKNDGNPLIQKASDPAKGYYISTTALQDGNKKYDNPYRYVNSEGVPYIALPSKFATDFKLGDIALVINNKNGKRCYAIFADIGPKNKIGEGSICLAKLLGLNSSPKNGGTASGIVYILFKNSGDGKVKNVEDIITIGRSKLTESEIETLLKE